MRSGRSRWRSTTPDRRGLNRERLRALQEVAVAHFADRYGDFIIICLGESIVSIGVGVSATGHQLSVALVGTAGLGLMIALGMWWTYFDRLAGAARERLRGHDDPVIVAADSYSYLHLVIVAGVIIYASGIRMVVNGALSPPMPTAGRLAFCGGVALYLAGVAAFRLRMLGAPSHGRIAVAVGLLVLFAVGGTRVDGHRHGDRADPGAVRARFAERPASLSGRHRRRPPRSHCHRARGPGR